MREKIKLESSAGTGHFYTTTKKSDSTMKLGKKVYLPLQMHGKVRDICQIKISYLTKNLFALNLTNTILINYHLP